MIGMFQAAASGRLLASFGLGASLVLGGMAATGETNVVSQAFTDLSASVAQQLAPPSAHTNIDVSTSAQGNVAIQATASVAEPPSVDIRAMLGTDGDVKAGAHADVTISPSLNATVGGSGNLDANVNLGTGGSAGGNANVGVTSDIGATLNAATNATLNSTANASGSVDATANAALNAAANAAANTSASAQAGVDAAANAAASVPMNAAVDTGANVDAGATAQTSPVTIKAKEEAQSNLGLTVGH